ncbi:MAG: hypothetical protein M3142_06460 [Bacteroidota bacterium]|nr:hypothetical protein [Bacteroidota bacterium]
MNHSDFNRGNHEQKAALVWLKGEFLADRITGEYCICLYSMGKFFAEIWYRLADNGIDQVKGFKNRALLEPYLELVDFAEITGRL